MRLYEALHQLADKYAPMSERSSVDLQSKASENYMRVLDEAEEIDAVNKKNAELNLAFDLAKTDAEKENLTKQLATPPVEKLEHKIIRFAEKWWVRYLIGALFVWVQPKIQNYLNPPPPVDPDDFGEDDRR